MYLLWMFFLCQFIGCLNCERAAAVLSAEPSQGPFRLVWTVLGAQEWVRPAFFSPISCLCCLGFGLVFFGVFLFFFNKHCSQRQLILFQKPDVCLGMSPSLCCQSTGMKLVPACGGLTAVLGCTDIWKYFSRFRNSQFSLLHLTWNSVIANNSMPGTRSRVKGIFYFSQDNYVGWKNHCLISLPLRF